MTLLEATEVKAPADGEWVLCRGMLIHVTEAEIAAVFARAYDKKHRRPRRRIVANIALGKRIGTYRDWPRSNAEVEDES